VAFIINHERREGVGVVLTLSCLAWRLRRRAMGRWMGLT
jgi:hypothetical protein